LFLRILAGKCSELTTRIAALQMQTVRERLLYYMGELCPKDGRCSFHLPISKRELAQQLGTSPETLSRTLRELQNEGVLQVNNRQIVMTDCLRKGRCCARPAQI
jgi:CRP-like cAMP-binding protein